MIKRRGIGPKIGMGIVHVVLITGALTMVLPFFWMVNTSLKALPDVFKAPFALPNPPLWANYPAVFTTIPFARCYLNTLLVTLARTSGVLLTSAMAAYAFARLRFPGREALFMLYLGTMMIPSQVTMIPNFVLMRVLGWRDTYQALIIPRMFSAFGVFLLRQFLLTIPRSLEEASFVDGAGRLQALIRIVLPLSLPGLAAAAMLAWLESWNEFTYALYLTVSRNTLPLQTFYYLNRGGIFQSAAYATVITIPVIAITFFLQRYLDSGVLAGAVRHGE